jgi:hypothetical protein
MPGAVSLFVVIVPLFTLLVLVLVLVLVLLPTASTRVKHASRVVGDPRGLERIYHTYPAAVLDFRAVSIIGDSGQGDGDAEGGELRHHRYWRYCWGWCSASHWGQGRVCC